MRDPRETYERLLELLTEPKTKLYVDRIKPTLNEAKTRKIFGLSLP